MNKHTPQEIADSTSSYVAMDKNGEWWLYCYEPMIEKNSYWVAVQGGYEIDMEIFDEPKDHDWHTLYRPNQEPIIVKEEQK